jgi:hypothetical protein
MKALKPDLLPLRTLLLLASCGGASMAACASAPSSAEEGASATTSVGARTDFIRRLFGSSVVYEDADIGESPSWVGKLSSLQCTADQANGQCRIGVYATGGIRTIAAQITAIDVDMTCIDAIHGSGVLTYQARGTLHVEVTDDGEGGHDYPYAYSFTVGCKNPYGPYPIWIHAEDGNDREQPERMVPRGADGNAK